MQQLLILPPCAKIFNQIRCNLTFRKKELKVVGSSQISEAVAGLFDAKILCVESDLVGMILEGIALQVFLSRRTPGL